MNGTKITTIQGLDRRNNHQKAATHKHHLPSLAPTTVRQLTVRLAPEVLVAILPPGLVHFAESSPKMGCLS